LQSFIDSKEILLNRAPSSGALVAFVRAAELGSFAAAARHLDMTAAAVGQAVARLEESFGVELISRTTRRMSLTADGRLLYARSRSLIGELDELGRVFDERRGTIAGPLRVSAPLGFGRRHVVGLLARFMARHPGIVATLDCSDTVRNLADDGVDVAFRIWRPTDSSIVARRISRLQAITVASPDYLRRHGTPASPRQLEGHACIAYRHPATGALEPMTFRVGGRDETLAPPARFVVNDVEAACEAAALGLGLAQPPSDYVAPFLAAKRLVRVLADHTAAPWTLYLCYRSKRLPRRVRAFVELARAELGSDRFVLSR
jgi:DNA-binding transcriptional LysR family regulator